ncbi:MULTISPECIES: hypothetical protein [Actinosynnema]|uniref:hypothetical protein n=1 Tax=Actinosynnema TaxID=40566 RepID=UPI0020A584C4|nr:hypothetical protein [Actinosynnema pretiosum]
MSRDTQSTLRRPALVVSRPQGTPLTPAQRRVVRRCRDLPAVADPLEAELTLSSAVADCAVDDEFWAGLVEHAVARSGPCSDALLGVLASAVTGRPGQWARNAVRPAGPPLKVGGSWTCDRTIDAGYLAVLCAYRFGDREHALVFLIDELVGSVVRKAFVTRQVSRTLAELAGQGPLTPLGSEAAHWLLAKSYERLDRRADLRVDPDVGLTRLMVRRRIALAFG